ncbi:MAG: BCD family MFS transporter [Kastovskya adunca ATA6-11-RM4]|jgi:BCD family chlorophyll transporter-like MFS transporter|nr:BCD family MFS transporter [Kastovskya adunca ATA6-11-RM4]
MAISDSPNSSEPSSEPKDQVIPRLDLLTMVRLGLFQMGLGIMAVLTLGILNRVMISELGVPAIFAAGAIAMHQFVAPARVWFGQLSDAKPLFGKHRSGYVWLGAAGFTIAAFLAVQIMWQLGTVVRAAGGWTLNAQTLGWTALLALSFTIYGLALSASSTPFTALLVDVSEEDNRSQLIGTTWSMLMVGIVIGGITGGVLLKRLEEAGVVLGANVGSTLFADWQPIKTPIETLQPPINSLFVLVPLIVFGLALLSTVGIEKKYSHYAARSTFVDREDKITLGRAIKVLTASRQTGLFFTFLLVMTLSLFMQEAVLEPYGGEVFNMPIAETTKLNSFWGLGTLVGVSTTGFLVVPRLGQQKTTRLGCLLVAICFCLIILSGFTHEPNLLRVAMLLFGLAAGITTTGALSLMLDLTAAETAGTFIGAWGLSQAMARAIATVTGGAVLTIGKALFTTPLLAYSLVFGLQAVGMLVAIGLLKRVNVKEFRRNTKDAIAAVMEQDLD